MIEGPDSPYRVPFDGSFVLADASQQPPSDAPGKKAAKKQLKALHEELDDLQRMDLPATRIGRGAGRIAPVGARFAARSSSREDARCPAFPRWH